MDDKDYDPILAEKLLESKFTEMPGYAYFDNGSEFVEYFEIDKDEYDILKKLGNPVKKVNEIYYSIRGSWYVKEDA